MHLVEYFNYRVTLPKEKSSTFFEVGSHPVLEAAIKECLTTGQEQTVRDWQLTAIWVVTPDWPTTVMTDEEGAKEKLRKVTVRLFPERSCFAVKEGSYKKRKPGFGKCEFPNCRAKTGLVNASFCPTCMEHIELRERKLPKG